MADRVEDLLLLVPTFTGNDLTDDRPVAVIGVVCDPEKFVGASHTAIEVRKRATKLDQDRGDSIADLLLLVTQRNIFQGTQVINDLV